MVSHQLTGWYARTQPHPSPQDFLPTRESLAFGTVRSAQVGLSITAVFFFPDIVVDSMGRVLRTQESDFVGLTALAKQILDLPPTGSFGNCWRVARTATCRPIEKAYVPNDNGQLTQTSVYAFVGGEPMVLSQPVGEYTELPRVLADFFSLVLEARQGYERGKVDREMTAKVLDIVRTRM